LTGIETWVEVLQRIELQALSEEKMWELLLLGLWVQEITLRRMRAPVRHIPKAASLSI
jgi:hypothetical protein